MFCLKNFFSNSFSNILNRTKHQLHGAAYGSGVYLAANSSVSFGYMRTGAGWSKSMFGSSGNMGCLALCEICNDDCLKGMPNPYYVVPKDELIRTSHFFVYPSGGSAAVEGKSVNPP